MERVNQVVDSKVGAVKIGEQLCNDWEVACKKSKKYLEDGRSKTDGKASKRKKKMVNKLLKDIDDDEHRWLQCNRDPKKTAVIFNLQEQMVETIR